MPKPSRVFKILFHNPNDTGRSIKINQNHYFGCFGILFYFFLLFWDSIFISYYVHIMLRAYIDVLGFVLGTFITLINLLNKIKAFALL